MRVLCLTLTFCLMTSSVCFASDAWAILRMIVTQTREHQQRLTELKRQVEYLRKEAEGIDGVNFATNFRNVIVEGEEFLNDIDEIVHSSKHFSKEWKSIFGDIEKITTPENTRDHGTINITDDINSESYQIGERYQEAYIKNANEISKLIENSKNVSTKGGIKQVAETLAHNLQMQNQLIFLMSQQIKQQSVDSANDNILRKEEVIRFQEENKAVRNFIDLADKGVTFP